MVSICCERHFTLFVFLGFDFQKIFVKLHKINIFSLLQINYKKIPLYWYLLLFFLALAFNCGDEQIFWDVAPTTAFRDVTQWEFSHYRYLLFFFGFRAYARQSQEAEKKRGKNVHPCARCFVYALVCSCRRTEEPKHQWENCEVGYLPKQSFRFVFFDRESARRSVQHERAGSSCVYNSHRRIHSNRFFLPLLLLRIFNTARGVLHKVERNNELPERTRTRFELSEE